MIATFKHAGTPHAFASLWIGSRGGHPWAVPLRSSLIAKADHEAAIDGPTFQSLPSVPEIFRIDAAVALHCANLI